MLPALLEKASFALAVPVLYAADRVPGFWLGPAAMDATWLVLFAVAFLRTPRDAVPAKAGSGNLDVVKRLYAAFADRDRATILELLDPAIEWVQNEGFPGGGRHVGAEAVLDGVFARFRQDWESWEAVVDEWIDAGDTVVAAGKYRGTYKASGRSTTAAFAHVYRVRRGRIVRFEQYTDTAKVAEAMQPPRKTV
jgi:ketosteroid isomerase-like protein